jgi:VWFA-related protein
LKSGYADPNLCEDMTMFPYQTRMKIRRGYRTRSIQMAAGVVRSQRALANATVLNLRKIAFISLLVSGWVIPSTWGAVAHDPNSNYEILWENFNSDAFPQLNGWVTVLQNGTDASEIPLGAFRLSEDGVDQPSLSVVPESDGLDIVLVVDASGSMREALAQSVAAVRLFLKNIGPRDRVALVGFNDLPRVLQSLTSDTRLVSEALGRLKPDGGTALYDTLVTSAGNHKPSMRRRVVVLLTDGCDQNAMGTGPGSRNTLDQAVESCRKSHAVVFGIGFGFQVDRKVLGRVTEETGGRAYWATGAGQLQDLYLRIVHDIRRRYRVVYQTTHPEKDGSKRSVQLVVRDGNLEGEGDTVYWTSRSGTDFSSRRVVERSEKKEVSFETPMPTPTPSATSTPTRVPSIPTSTFTATRVPPTPTTTCTETPHAVPVAAKLSLQWNGQELGTEDLGQLAVFADGNFVSARTCQILSWTDRLPPRAVFFMDRRAFLTPGRYLIRAQVGGLFFEGQGVVEAGLLNKIALSPARNP